MNPGQDSDDEDVEKLDDDDMEEKKELESFQSFLKQHQDKQEEIKRKHPINEK